MGELVNLDDFRVQEDIKEEIESFPELNEQEAKWIIKQLLTQSIFNMQLKNAQQMVDEIMSQIESEEE